MSALDDLVDLLDLEAIEMNIFRGVSPDESRQRVFGGQVAGHIARGIHRRKRHGVRALCVHDGRRTVGGGVHGDSLAIQPR